MKNIIVNKTGIAEELFWGYVGLIFFMLGATIETSWFSSYLTTIGFQVKVVSLLFSFYGIFVAFFSWITSFLVNRFSIKKVMLVSLLLALFSTGILLFGLTTKQVWLIFLGYMLRGTVYPLFAYSFLVAVTIQTPAKKLGRGTSWFWLCFNLGMTIIGPVFATRLLKLFDPFFVFIAGAGLILIGGVITVARCEMRRTKDTPATVWTEMKEGIQILFQFPRLSIGLLVKGINNIGQFGFVIMMPIFLLQHQFTLVQWTSAWAICYVVNSFAGIIFGSLGDKYGWRKIVTLFSGTITGLSCLLLIIVINYFPGNFILLLLAFIVFAIGIAAFTPLSALIPSMVPDNKVAAVSVLNLGSGLSNFFGPILVTLLFQQYGGNFTLIVFAVLYFAGSLLSTQLKTPADETSKEIESV
ncbi:MFS transporter [Enterococcus hulanensis]|uniref:RbtT/DalT/CsbX family MFS transporter n=1 Tax=Enterococcus hulanensis TaxID=2559929 RepID=UPI001A8F459A|nr:RbtT/DalT/CsbX family MFS transporter [Enterococcus hulanensis]MBO0458070.1 MFS transporter [Enterococcus hulanensis]